VVVRSRSLRLSSPFVTLRLAPGITPQPPRCRQRGFRLFPVRSPLLRESRLISVPGGTEMFHFPPLASPPCHRAGMTGYYPSQVSPFGHPRLTARLAAPRGFSQLAAPFLACPCPGIPRTPLVAYPHSSSYRATMCIYPFLFPFPVRVKELPTHHRVSRVMRGTPEDVLILSKLSRRKSYCLAFKER
jgi:hypothetical protein